ncbi:hypothetical protein SOVF_084060 [Spinacia oleracea]|nr:hypothetical protein SOVF_084060 [Spinacia oleracea]
MLPIACQLRLASETVKQLSRASLQSNTLTVCLVPKALPCSFDLTLLTLEDDFMIEDDYHEIDHASDF